MTTTSIKGIDLLGDEHRDGQIMLGQDEAKHDPDALSVTTLSRWLEEIRNQPEWRREADKCADYYDGNQLDTDTLQALEDKGLGPLITNLIAPTVNAVLGMEAKTRTDWHVGADDDRYTRIEAAAQGWWYSNRLPGTEGNETRRLVVMLSDKDLPAARLAAHARGFDQLLEDSTHIAPLLKARSYRACGKTQGAPANSQRLQDFCGDAWMAVGDAAQAYDPLSSQGMDKALQTGSHAGHMLHYALTDGPQDAAGLGSHNAYIHQYDAQQRQFWETYVSQRALYYRMQPRWSDQPFWQRRR